MHDRKIFTAVFKCDGNVEARLTGHGNSKPVDLSFVSSLESPEYCVSGSAVELAAGSYKHAIRNCASKCDSGSVGNPCGECDTFADAARDAFTRVILGAAHLPDCAISARLRNSVSAVTGITLVEDQFGDSMDDDDVCRMIEEFGEKGEE